MSGDTSAFSPNGIRIGTFAMTTRGLKENDMVNICDFIDKCINIGIQIKKEKDPKTLKDFIQYFNEYNELDKLRSEIKNWVINFKFYD